MSEKPVKKLLRTLSQEQKLALWEALVEKSSDIITLHDKLGRVIYASPSAEKLFGALPDEMPLEKLSSIFRYIAPEDRPNVKHEFDQILTAPGQVAGPVTYRMRVLDGSWKYLESVACNLMDKEAIQGILVVTRDVTERTETEKQLVQSEWRYRSLVENSPEAIAVSQNGLLKYANNACLRLIGAASLDQIKDLEVIGFVHYEDRQRVEQEILPASSGQPVLSIPARLTSFSGDEIQAEITAIPVIFDSEPSLQIVIHDVTEQRRAIEALEYQSMHDPLTGLPNRALFMDRVTQALNRAQRFGGRIVVMLADIDRFKIVNDSLGHAVGDKLLIAVAERIKNCFRPSDTVARFGGDEFVILCEDTEELTNLGSLGERLLHAIKEPIVVQGESFHLSLSVGITEADGSFQRADDLLREADSAMNRAKERGRQRYEIFDVETGHNVTIRLQLESEFRNAIARNELRAFYQPVVNATTGEVTGVEALTRWQHPQKGLMSPAAFIPVAEESGLIVPLGMWILEEAARQLKEWGADLEEGRTFSMSVNLSARQLLDPQLLDKVKQVVTENELDGKRLQLHFEVTESVLMEERAEVAQIMNDFRDLGVGIVIDDFGTGYSSFTYLKRFPVEMLKIDRSFVIGLGERPDDEAIVEAIVKLARALNIDVVAEGVETETQLYHIRSLGCNLIQGFYFAKPSPAIDISQYIKKPFAVPPLKI